MRYAPRHNGPSARLLDPGARPPAELIPDKLAGLLVERDAIADRVSAANTALAHLADDARDLEAAQADGEAAALAARAGKPIPAPKAEPKLIADRQKAVREYDAHRAALAAITAECEDVKSAAYFASEDPRPDLLAAILPKAEALAAELGAAVAAFAARDWLGGSAYFTDARVWSVDIDTDLRRHGLSNANTTAFAARELIMGAVVQTLTAEEA